MNDLIKKQREIEQDSVDRGVANYRKQLARVVEKGEGMDTLPPGIQLLKAHIDAVTEGITEWIASVEGGKANRNANLIKVAKDYKPEILAYVTLRTLIGRCSMGSNARKLTRVAFVVASELEDMSEAAQLKAAGKKDEALKVLARRLEQKAKRATASYRHVLVRRQMKYAKSKLGFEAVRWDADVDPLKFGQHLIEIAVAKTGLFSVFVANERHRGKINRVSYVEPTKELNDWLAKANNRSEVLRPVYLPMVVPPKPWTDVREGGYHHIKMPFVRTDARHLEELSAFDLDRVYRAVNAVQAVAWRINKPVLDVAKVLWDERGGGVAGLPYKDDVEVPVKTHSADLPGDHPDVVAWKRKAHYIHNENRLSRAQRVAVSATLQTAEEYAGYEAVYFPHNLDWRGRIYPIPQGGLHPQSDDFGRGMLEFSRGAPLGDTGAYWLAVHGANCYGIDKVSFDDRVQWVQDHEAEIVESAMNPLAPGAFWTLTKDDRWQFLAFCKEWAGLLMHVRSGQPQQSYVSRLPVGVDGTCNGLQHYAALMRDPSTAAVVGMVKADKPSDLYSVVASLTQSKVDVLAQGGNEVAARWVGKVTRKWAKRNCMTRAYSVTDWGMVDQLMKEFADEVKEARKAGTPLPAYTVDDAKLLAELNKESIDEVVVAAQQGQLWLEQAAAVVVSGGLPFRFVTPSGFPMVQRYFRVKGRVIDFTVFGKRQQLTIQVKDRNLDPQKMVRSIAPNVIHSLDGSALVNTVLRCLDAGVQDFAFVHDSYATHAGSIDVLNRALREAFIGLYSENVLQFIRDQLVEQLRDRPDLVAKLPPLPKLGDYDVEQVREADYFFA